MGIRLVIVTFVVAILSACGGGGGGGEGSGKTDSLSPSISVQPKPISVFSTQAADFTVTAAGEAPLSFQWRKDGMNIVGQTSSSYKIDKTAVGDGGKYSVVVSNSKGAVSSDDAELTVLEARPGFSSQPEDKTVNIGQTATFGVAAVGMPTLLYQWRKNGVDISGATASSYTTPVTSFLDNGAKFSVSVSNDVGSTVSTDALLNVIATFPGISTQPLSQTVGVGQSATFGVVATGNPAPTYQWRRNGVAIGDANMSSYTTPAASAIDHLANYSVVVSNISGEVISSNARLIISGGLNAATTCGFSNTSSASDPLIGYAWHIKNNNLYFASNKPSASAGVDLCMGGLWASGNLGNGVKVNVIDEGLEIVHEDLSANIIANASQNFVNGTKNPTNTALDGDHGTSVAGLISSSRGNTKGGSGVAPGSKLMGYNLLLSQSSANYAISFGATAGYGATTADIFNFSAGSSSAALSSPFAADDVIFNNLANLRNGKGGLFIKSAGNGFKGMGVAGEDRTFCNASGISCQNANQDTDNTSQTALVVAALGADGAKSSYSTTGSSIWISGFGGEYGYDSAVAGVGYIDAAYKPALLTTDQSACTAGYSRSGQNKNQLDKGDGTGTSNASCNYTAGFNGTSSAAPTVSGVVALMLEANPQLTWRDVKHILATTARRVNPNSAPITISGYFPAPAPALEAEQGWVLNAGNYYYHNWYGFGLVNAAAAVAMAKAYTPGSLGSYTFASADATSISPFAVPAVNIAGLSKTFNLNGGPATVEQAELMLHVGTGFVPLCHQIELKSPSGTKSILLNMDTAHTSTSTSGVRFLSNAFYGEPSAGAWTLKIINSCTVADAGVQNLSSTVAQKLTIRGR